MTASTLSAIDAGQRHERQHLEFGLQDIDRRLPGRLPRPRARRPKQLTVHPLGARQHLARFRPHPIAGHITGHHSPPNLVCEDVWRRAAVFNVGLTSRHCWLILPAHRRGAGWAKPPPHPLDNLGRYNAERWSAIASDRIDGRANGPIEHEPFEKPVSPNQRGAGFFGSRSERIGIRLVLDGHPLPLGEFIPIGRTADARAVARSTRSAERNMRFIGDGLIVDV